MASQEWDWISDLHCPYCRERLDVAEVLESRNGQIWDGIARCSCSRFPITEGILNLGGNGRNHLERAVKLLLDKRVEAARLVQIEIERIRKSYPARAIRRLDERYAQKRFEILTPIVSAYRRMTCKPVLGGTTFRDALRPLRGGDFADYLENRFSHPSLLASLPVIMLFSSLEAESILDLGCGAGHQAYLISRARPDARLTCLDKFYINLLLARRFTVPNARLICHNLDYPLPFEDPYDIVFSSDTIHYVDYQKETAAECLRVLKPEGYLFFCHLHNSMVFNFGAGRPLTPTQWKELFSGIPNEVYPESEILKEFTLNNRFDLGALPADCPPEESNALILVGSGKQDFRTLSIDDPFSRFLEMEGNWVLNPIYRRRSGDGDKDVYEFTWFSENYKVECPQLEEIMAPRIELPKGLEALKPIKASREELLEMAKKLAVLNIPDNYA